MKKQEEAKTTELGFDTSLLLDNSPQISNDYQNEADILNYQINKNGVKNIAIVAGFGAGKSSLIETYLDKYKKEKSEKKKYTKVSLASFNDTKYNASDIERSILQQLLYSRHKNLFPNSKIERTVKTKTHIVISLLITFLASLIIALQMLDGGTFFKDNLWIKWVFLGLIIVITFILLMYITYYRKFKKVKYKDFELVSHDNGDDVVSTNGESLINRFVDEILYFFECSSINLVIFEDLDRLEIKTENGEMIDQSSAIFVKLRELNTIINNSHEQQNRHKVTFLYAVKDDLIKDQEQRGKFFEFILPIISVLNPITTVNKILEIQKKVITDHKELELKSEFIHEVSNYIPNMRILKNTFNDFLITRARLFNNSGKSKLKNENLYAMCLYKNLYPFEYSLLESKQGLIPLIIDTNKVIKIATTSNNAKIKELENNLEIEKEIAVQSFEELKMLFRGNMINYSHNYSRYGTTRIDEIKTFKDLDIKTVYHPYQTSYAMQLDLIPKLPNGDTYFEREQKIKLHEGAASEEIVKEIAKIKNENNQYANMGFNKLIHKIGINEYFSDEEQLKLQEEYKDFLEIINKNEAKKLSRKEKTVYFRTHMEYIKFLIQNDYIDEHYIEYTSNFQSELLSLRDISYIKNVQQGTLDFEAELDNLENIIKMLQNKNFSQITVINKCILKNLDKIEEFDSTKYHLIKKLINTNDSQVIELLIQFLIVSESETIIEFLRYIDQDNIVIYENIISAKVLTKEKKDIILTNFIINHSKVEELETKIIQKYLSESDEYHKILSSPKIEDYDSIKKFVLAIKPKIVKLNKSTDEITKFIISKNYYEINIDNLIIVLDMKENTNDFFEKNYEYIELNSPTLKEYVLMNINEYVTNVMLNERITNINEKFDFISFLLKENDLDKTTKIYVIEKHQFIIDDIFDFQPELYESLLINNRIKPDWSNIFKMYVTSVNLELLINFLLYNAKELTGVFEYKSEDFDDSGQVIDYCSNLFFDIANYSYKDNELRNLEVILKTIYSSAKSCKNFKEDKTLELFIKSKKVSFNENDLKYLIKMPFSLLEYVVYYEKDIETKFDGFFDSIDFQTINKLLLTERVSLQIKQKILTQFANIANINGFEHQYFDLISRQKMIIPIEFTTKFVNSTLKSEEKTALLEFTIYNEKEISTLVDFLESTIHGLNDIDKRMDIEYGNGISDKVLKDYAKYKGYQLSNYMGKAIIRPKK